MVKNWSALSKITIKLAMQCRKTISLSTAWIPPHVHAIKKPEVPYPPVAVKCYKSSVSRCIMKNAPAKRAWDRRGFGRMDSGGDLTRWIEWTATGRESERKKEGKRNERWRFVHRWPDKIVCLYCGSQARFTDCSTGHCRLRFSTPWRSLSGKQRPFRPNWLVRLGTE